MIEPDERSALEPLWRAAVREGLIAFAVVGAVGVIASLAVWLVARPAYGFAVALRVGAIYLGAFHHVPVRIEGEFDIGELTGGVLPSSDLPTSGSSFVEIGVALLLVTALAGWLLFRAGGRVADAARGSWMSAALRGAAVAPAYALGVLLVALLVRVDEPVRFGRLVEGRLQVSLGTWQALAFPLLIAAVAGAAGGLWAWLGSRPDHPRARAATATLAGGWRTLWVGLALSYVGLFVAGVVQPDEPVAMLTPSTARYYRTVFERPGVGSAVLGHHLTLAPNEAVWTVVPAMGGCDVVLGGEDGDVLCYGRFPREAAATPDAEEGRSTFGSAPAPYLLFVLAPAVAAVLGGREAARRSGVSGWAGAATGALAGIAFAPMLGATSLLAGVSLSYGASVGSEAGGGSLWVGPDIAAAVVLGLVWGVLGGALGGAASRVRSAAASRGGRRTPR